MEINDEYLRKFNSDCLADISFFAENDIAPLHIAPEEGPIRRVKLRRVQQRLAEVVNRQWFNRGFLRVVVCKARRIGSTTFFSMDAYRQASLRPNTNVVVGAQLDDMASEIHKRNHVFYTNYPSSLRPERWGRSRSFKEPMEFRRDVSDRETRDWELGGKQPETGLNSTISIFTERTPLARTGATIQYLLLSEFAKYRNQSTIIKEMFPTVRKNTGAIVIDTTAESRGDSYSRLWEEAIAGRSEFEPVFISWLDDEQQCHQQPTVENSALFYDWLQCNSRGDTSGLEKYSSLLNLDDDEFDLLQNHIVPRWSKNKDEQIYHPMGWIEWRRWAIQDRCDGKAQVFKNQYPTHWREAFMSSTLTIFDMSQVASQADRVRDEESPVRGELIEKSGRRALEPNAEAMMAQVKQTNHMVTPDMFTFIPESFGPLRIYETPIKGEEYIISSDYAEGQSAQCDYNVIHVYKRGDKLTQVAHFREKCYPEESASEAIALGAYYNMAWQIPEVNSCGAAALAMFRSCYPINRIFRRKSPDNVKNAAPSKYLGWRMTGRSKSEAVSAATAYFKKNLCVIKNANTLRELEVFVKKSSRMLPEAMAGTDPITGERYHDDEVTCMILGIYANRQLPYLNGQLTKGLDNKPRECQHLIVAGGICLRCRFKVPEAQPKVLTFEDLRSTVKANSKKRNNPSSLLGFWVPNQ
tara:strand:- start:11492 stop:13576 length:2085 start_codon:yes stop_codon:yes gene_type:complete